MRDSAQPPGILRPPDIAPMLAERGIPRSLDGWEAERKLDGWRSRVLADDGLVRLRTRSGRDIATSVRSTTGSPTAV